MATRLRIFANSRKRAVELARMKTRNKKSEVSGMVVSNVRLVNRPINADDKKTYIARLRERKR